jgi:hypothetical protein
MSRRTRRVNARLDVRGTWRHSQFWAHLQYNFSDRCESLNGARILTDSQQAILNRIAWLAMPPPVVVGQRAA